MWAAIALFFRGIFAELLKLWAEEAKKPTKVEVYDAPADVQSDLDKSIRMQLDKAAGADQNAGRSDAGIGSIGRSNQGRMLQSGPQSNGGVRVDKHGNVIRPDNPNL